MTLAIADSKRSSGLDLAKEPPIELWSASRLHPATACHSSRSVIELTDQFVSSTFGIALNGSPLPPVAVSIGADVGGGRGSYVGDCGPFCYR
jgi:hypothetical protein